MSFLIRLLNFSKGLALVTSGNALASILGGIFGLVIATILPVRDFELVNFHISIATAAYQREMSL